MILSQVEDILMSKICIYWGFVLLIMLITAVIRWVSPLHEAFKRATNTPVKLQRFHALLGVVGLIWAWDLPPVEIVILWCWLIMLYFKTQSKITADSASTLQNRPPERE